MDELIVKEIEATKEASDRARGVLLVTQIACIVIFMAGWHELPWGWTFTRMHTLQAAVWVLDCVDQKHVALGTETAKTKDYDQCHFLDVPDSKTTALQPFTPDEIDRARTYLKAGRLTSAEAKKALEAVHASVSDRIMNVSVPFLGITLDINDLGILGGITFTLLLVWFDLSLRREQQNLAFTFKTKSSEDLESAYKLLSMTQVLTITPETKVGENRIRRSWCQFVERALICTPLLVQLFVVGVDYGTSGFARLLNPGFARAQVSMESGLLAIVLLLTIWCGLKAKAIDREWEGAYKRLAQHTRTKRPGA
jgi:hypothetical protein